MTIGTIIWIVLGVLVLVFLIWGFSVGWGNLWSKITSFTGGSANVDTVRQACALACAKGEAGRYDFCYNLRTARLSSTEKEKGSCHSFGSNVGIESCSEITCDTNDERYPKNCVEFSVAEGDTYEWFEETGDRKCKEGSDKTSVALDVDDNKGKKCCVPEE